MAPISTILTLVSQYTNSTKRADPTIKTQANYVGNNLKNLRISVANSLKLLNTDYIDILYVHYWDLHSSVEEIMDGLHQLVLAGKVLYLVRHTSWTRCFIPYLCATTDRPQSLDICRVSRMRRPGSWLRQTTTPSTLEKRPS